MMSCINDEKYAKRIPEIFEKYKFDYEEYSESDEGFSKVIELVESVLRSNEDSLIRDRRDDVKDLDEVSEIYDELGSIKRDLMSDLFPYSYIDYEFGIDLDEDYWNQKIEENVGREDRQADEFDDYDYHREGLQEVNEDEKIDDLFNTAN